jgi:hypothetical protein
MKQTAVEWLIEQITYDNGFGQRRNSFTEDFDLSAYFEKAKEMEKEQTLRFGIKCQLDFIKSDAILSVEDLYESTFNQQTK